MARAGRRHPGGDAWRSGADDRPAIGPALRSRGRARRAIAHYLAAGDQARLLYADEPARAAYERALALARTLGDDEQAARIHMRLGLTHHERMDFEEAQAAYAEGLRLWNRASVDPEQRLPPADQPFRIIWGLAPRNEEPSFDLIPDLFSGLVEETPELEHRSRRCPRLGDQGRGPDVHLSSAG